VQSRFRHVETYMQKECENEEVRRRLDICFALMTMVTGCQNDAQAASLYASTHHWQTMPPVQEGIEEWETVKASISASSVKPHRPGSLGDYHWGALLSKWAEWEKLWA